MREWYFAWLEWCDWVNHGIHGSKVRWFTELQNGDYISMSYVELPELLICFFISMFSFFLVGTVSTQLRKPFIQGISDCPWWGDKAMYGKWGFPPRIDGKDSSLLRLTMAVDVKCGSCALNPCFSKLWLLVSPFEMWVCLKIGYIPNYSHLIGIMISKTIGFRGTLFSDTPMW